MQKYLSNSSNSSKNIHQIHQKSGSVPNELWEVGPTESGPTESGPMELVQIPLVQIPRFRWSRFLMNLMKEQQLVINDAVTSCQTILIQNVHENIHEIGGQTKIWSLFELWQFGPSIGNLGIFQIPNWGPNSQSS